MSPPLLYHSDTSSNSGKFSLFSFKNLDEKVLDFLNQDVYKNSLILGLILENGFDKLLNKKILHIYQNVFGEIEGVGYFGRKNFCCAKSYDALVFFAEIISQQPKGAIILCEEESSSKLHQLIGLHNRTVSTYCMENLMIARENQTDLPKTNYLRFAHEKDHHFVLNANAEIIHLERGYNPLETHKDDFIESIYKLIRNRKTLIWSENDELICKIDIGPITPQVVYLEGIYVSPFYRGKGIGFQCLQEVKNMFMKNDVSLSLLVKNDNHSAVNLYKKLNFYNYCNFNFAYLQN